MTITPPGYLGLMIDLAVSVNSSMAVTVKKILLGYLFAFVKAKRYRIIFFIYENNTFLNIIPNENILISPPLSSRIAYLSERSG